jgi:hypothetical protein
VLIVGIALGFGGAWAIGTTQDRPALMLSYALSQNHLGGPQITINVATGSGAAFTLVIVAEHHDRVDVSVRERVSRGPRTADLAFYRFTWNLSEPLGSRPVLDTSTGNQIPVVTTQW